MFPFRNKLTQTLPRWLVNIPGSQVWAVVSAFGEELDRLAYFARQAWYSWLIANAPLDVLRYSGAVRKLPRYMLDTDSSYRNRLHRAFDFYQYLGADKSIVDTFALLGVTATVISENEWSPEDRPDEIQMWNRIWVQIEGLPPISPWNKPEVTWNSPSALWNRNYAAKFVLTLREIVLRCRSCSNLFVGFVAIQEDGTRVFLNFNDE